FRYTATERAQQSARYFANGLFGRDAKDVVFAPTTKVDLVLRFYKHCDKWQKQVKKNPETYVERGLFGVSPEMNMTLQHVSRILGFNTTLSLGS
ncbi:putative multiple inositol polyphosphate phosphatase 1, partial [Operophtera brumata]